MKLLLIQFLIIVIIQFISAEKIRDVSQTVKQTAIFDALQHVNQHEGIVNKLWTATKTFKWTDDIYKHIEKPEVAKEWKMYVEPYNFIGKDEIFSIMNELHRKEAIALFNVFYYINDWDIFYNVMSWARFNLNEGVFRYALNVAVVHKHDMDGIILPQPYETKPNYYFDSYVIQKAQSLKMKGFPTISDSVKVDEDKITVTIPAYEVTDNLAHNVMMPDVSTEDNTYHSKMYPHVQERQYEIEMLKYFTEDVDLNALYYWLNINYPTWMSSKEFGLDKDRRGELYWFAIREIVARYESERYSHGMNKIVQLDYTNQLITQGYQSQLRYYNGIPFPTRHPFYNYKKSHVYDMVDIVDYEHDIREAIKWGYVDFTNDNKVNFTDPQSIETLTDWFLGTPDSLFNVHNTYGYHEMMVKKILGGFQYNVPNYLEHYETSLRDPMFYMIYKRWLQTIYWEWMKRLPSYKYDDLHYDGVKIESVVISKLMTYFKIQEYDITNVVDVSAYETTSKKGKLFEYGRTSHYHGQDLVIKAQKKQLNHIPFTITMNVSSQKKEKAYVKIYLGPATTSTTSSTYNVNKEHTKMEYERQTSEYLNDNILNWYFLDAFVVELNEGKNILTRNCHEFVWMYTTTTSYYELYKQLWSSAAKSTQFPVNKKDLKYHCGRPLHLFLPHGKVGGIPYQFYFIIVPHIQAIVKPISADACNVGSGVRYTDNLSIGFPFDRRINVKYWYTPNMYYRTEMIYHKYDDMNIKNVTN